MWLTNIYKHPEDGNPMYYLFRVITSLKDLNKYWYSPREQGTTLTKIPPLYPASTQNNDSISIDLIWINNICTSFTIILTQKRDPSLSVCCSLNSAILRQNSSLHYTDFIHQRKTSQSPYRPYERRFHSLGLNEHCVFSFFLFFFSWGWRKK